MKKYFLLPFLLTLFFSCGTPKIQVRNISGYQEVQQGDTARIFWDFANAKYVKIAGDDKTFAPKDSFKFVAFVPIRLEIIAYQSEQDSLSQYVYVVVSSVDKSPPQTQKIQRGPNLIPNLLEYKNETTTDNFSGFSSSPFNAASILKIVRGKFDENRDSVTLDFVLLDQNGNLVYNLDKFSRDVALDIYQNCSSAESFRRTIEFPFTLKSFGKINVHILLEKNLTSFLPNLKDNLLDGIKYLANEDGFSIFMFGVELEPIISFQNFDKAYWQIKNFSFQPKIELASTFKSTIEFLDKIPDDSNNVLILVIKSNDNSSILYTYDELIEAARKKGISIYTILVGNEGSPALYKYISNKTFGGFYHLLWDYANQISKVIGEIILSNKFCYSISFINQLKDKNCTEITYKLVARQSLHQVSNTYSLITVSKYFYTEYQAVATYKFLDTTVSKEFFPILLQLADLLKKHPDVAIEIIGNASLEENLYSPEIISLSRANNVRKELVTLGVNPNQIYIKGRGTTKPLFQIEDDEFTKILNRRTEFRWIHPSILPYTIVVNTVETEEQAEMEIALWEKRGFKSYYERILNKGEVAYRIVLWGYSDIKTAEKTSRLITKKFGIHTFIE